MNHKKSFVINLVSQIAVFASNMVINFLLTPIVLEKLGKEAYGFIGLINNFINYAVIITIALNALAGRYITLAYHKGDHESAKEYYSSVFYANTVISAIIFAASLLLSANISSILNVPAELLSDVRLTVVLSAINTIISLLTVVYGVAAFIKNKLYLNSLSQMVAAVAKVVIIVSLFAFFTAHMWYYALSAIVAALITLIIQKAVTKKLCPNFVVRRKYYRWARVWEILKNGLWVSLESFNKVLQTGLDLLISNLFVSPAATGLFSVAKTIPNVLTQISGTIVSVFNPELAQLYAEDKKEELTESFRFTIRFLSMVMIVPLVGFISFGLDFYTLWLPDRSAEEVKLIQQLSVLTVAPLLVNAYSEGLYYANVLTKKIKGSVLITFGFSVASIICEVILLVTSSINPLYIIAGTSAFFMTIRYLFVTPIYAAKILKLPIFTFFPSIIRALVISGVLAAFFISARGLVQISSWKELILVCGGCAIIGYAFVLMGIFSSQERKKVLGGIKKKLLRKR